MMRRLFFSGTLLFWLVVATLAVLTGLEAPAPRPHAPPPGLSLAEVARHARAEDCWMVIRGTVYDLSAYVPDHPSKPGIFLPWCGREATEAYQTKTLGRAHSPRADQQLRQYAIGVVH